MWINRSTFLNFLFSRRSHQPAMQCMLIISFIKGSFTFGFTKPFHKVMVICDFLCGLKAVLDFSPVPDRVNGQLYANNVFAIILLMIHSVANV